MNMTINRPILIAGFGSIGRRHLQNLQTLGYKNLVLYRSGKSTLPTDEIADIPAEYDLDKALARKPLATIVANPTALHMRVALAAAKMGSHLFLEKPVSHTMGGVEELRRLVREKNLIVLVGFQFRFHPLLRKIKRLLEEKVIGPVVSIQAHWGEYLPDWHPGEDYRQGYSAKAKLGGGVILTLCHPFDYLRWLIGEVTGVSAMEGRSGGLKIDVEDSADVLLQFKSGTIGNVHLDYLERPAEYSLRIIGQSGKIHWDNTDGLLKWYSKTGEWEEMSVPDGFERNKLFLLEMRHFIGCIAGNEQPLCSLYDGIETLRIALAAKQSAKEKQVVKI